MSGPSPSHSPPTSDPAPHASQLHPPFPKPGTNTDAQDQPPHPNAEAFINAAAKHIVPDHPAPTKEEGQNAERQQPQGRDSGKEDAPEPREEEPIIGGTPLDELKTPMFEKSGFGMSSLSSSLPVPKRRETSETLRPLPEEEVDPFTTGANAMPSGAGRPNAPPRFDSVGTVRPHIVQDNLHRLKSAVPVFLPEY